MNQTHPGPGRLSPGTIALSVVLVPLWTSGFVGGKIATAHVPVLATLFWRFLVAAVVMTVAACVGGARRPRGRQWMHLTVVALLLQVGQFLCVYSGLAHGVAAGASSLVMGMSPLFVALLAPLWFPERLTRLTVIGLALGALGVYVVLSADLTDVGSVAWLGVTLVGMMALTAGTLYQKRFGADVDVRSSVAVQMTVSAAVIAPLLLAGGGELAPHDTTGWAAVGWLGVANSAGAFGVLYALLRRVPAAHVSSLLNLVPAATAIVSVPVLGEPLTARAVVGLGIALVGMYVGLILGGRPARVTSRCPAADDPEASAPHPRRVPEQSGCRS